MKVPKSKEVPSLVQVIRTATAEITGKDHPTLTRIIDLLCKKGLTERKIQANDRRCFTIHLTELGIQRVAEWEPNMAEIRMKAWQNLTEEDYKNLKRILDTIYMNLDEQEKLLTES